MVGNQFQKIYDLFLHSEGVCIDTRKTLEGKIFFALSGEHFDGNKFADQALEKGAVAAVIDDPLRKKDQRYLVVEDVLKTLQALASYHRARFDIPLIAITGTNGKTTTKELVATVLKSKYRLVATQGNLNNHIGVPLTLLNINARTEIAVVEMGANHPGEIAFLCELAQPNYGMITNIGKAHLEGFGGFEGVIKTKKELYDYLNKHNGVAFVNGDDERLVELSKNLSRILYCSDGCDVKGNIVSRFPFLKLRIDLRGEKLEIATKLYGDYNFPNVMASVAVADHFGVNAEFIKRSLEQYEPANNRSQIKKTDRNKVIMDAYNANPTSMAQAVKSFKEAGFEEPCLILGDMFELGEASEEEHRKIVKLILEKHFPCVYLVGQAFSKVSNEFPVFKTTEEALEYFKQHPVSQKTILLKGSRGMRLESLMSLL